MTKLTQLFLAGAVLLTGVAGLSASSMAKPYDNSTVRSQIDLNTSAGSKAFWESIERNGR